jgi:hypothetical protein
MPDQGNLVMGRLQALMDDIDNWCGTRPPGPPRPRGMKDLLVAVAIGELAAQVSNGDVREQMQAQVTRLMDQAQQEIGRGR